MRRPRWPVLLCLLVVAGPATAQELSRAVVADLRQGGHILYFRHAGTDWSQADRIATAGDWRSCDGARVRQLSDAGREVARAIGAAIRRLGIPVATVLSSEYCRAVETARLMDLGPVETTPDIMNMRAAGFVGGEDAVIARARRILATPPPAGANVVIAGHGNLMRAAIGTYTGEAGATVVKPAPDQPGGFVVVAVVEPEDWTRLADEAP